MEGPYQPVPDRGEEDQDLDQQPESTQEVEVLFERRQINAELPGGRSATIIVSEYHGQPIRGVPPPPPAFLPTESASQMSSMQSVFTLCNSAIGAGVLALPFAFEQTGLIGGIIGCLIIGSTEGFTLYVLSKFAERYSAPSYGVLVRRTLGKKLTALLASIMVMYLFGSCVVYLIIMGDTFSALGDRYFGGDSLLASRAHIILFIGFIVLLPLCLLKKLGHLAGVSALAVGGFCYTALVIMVLGVQQAVDRWPQPLEGVKLVNWHVKALYAVPIIVFGFNCHANVVSVFSELSKEGPPLLTSLPSSPREYQQLSSLAPRPGSYKLINMIGVIVCAVTFVMSAYICVGASGYIGFPGQLGGNVLNALPGDNRFVQVAQGVIGLVVLAHYPLSHFPARSGVQDIFTLLGFHAPDHLSDLFSVFFVGGSVCVALAVTSLGDVLHIIGGTAAAFMIFFLPGLILINAAIKKTSITLLDTISKDPTKGEGVDELLLRQAVHKGIKKTGLIYSPRRSWAAGLGLVLFSVAVLVITISTV